MIREVTVADIDSWIDLRIQLWPRCTRNESKEETVQILNSDRETCFVSVAANQPKLIGFIEVSTRDYVDGCSSSPVGYVEGIYVAVENRGKGIGKKLIDKSYDWMKSKGCSEVGSDALIENQESIGFHAKIGFKEVERHVVFMKQIDAIKSQEGGIEK